MCDSSDGCARPGTVALKINLINSNSERKAENAVIEDYAVTRTLSAELPFSGLHYNCKTNMDTQQILPGV